MASRLIEEWPWRFRTTAADQSGWRCSECREWIPNGETHWCAGRDEWLGETMADLRARNFKRQNDPRNS